MNNPNLLIDLCVLLGITATLYALKLAGVITWVWVWVLFPIWFIPAIILIVAGAMIITGALIIGLAIIREIAVELIEYYKES